MTTDSSPNQVVGHPSQLAERPGESDPPRDRRRRRHGGSGSGARSLLRWTTAVLLGLCIVWAPMACGAVHQATILVTLGLAAALAAVTGLFGFRNRAALKPAIALAIPLLFLALSALQIVPLPLGLRARIDPAGSELLALANLHGSQPLSLDPPATYLELAKAAAALSIALAALVLSADRRFRFLPVGLVAATGLAAMVVGIGHRAISEEKIYGLFQVSRGLPVGPFINPNHLAEFFELAAFAALAFAYSRSSRDGQRVWKILAAVLAACALSTLSRGSVLALGAGALTWFLLAPKSDEGEPLHRSRFATGLISLLVVAGMAFAFGAENLFGRFTQSPIGQEPRLALWQDALRIIPVHPAGIGLGAFARVYPIYRTFPSKAWFQFPENQPLGFAIEAGVFGMLIMVGLCVLVSRYLIKNARRDRIETSLMAGLVAVLAHNLTDFGLETMGVLLPFCAIAGAIFSRQATLLDQPVRQPTVTVWAMGATAAVVTAFALLLTPSARNFDGFLRLPGSPTTRAAINEASTSHPTDYLYALAASRLESAAPHSAATRLRMINRAILLCPSCQETHAEAARNLWRLGRRQQAILEWRTVLGLVPEYLRAVFAELRSVGAKPEELADLGSDSNRYELSQLLVSHGMVEAARGLLAAGGDHQNVDYQLAKAKVALAANDLDAAGTASKAALAVAPKDARVVLLASEVALRSNQREKALEILQAGLRDQPTDLELNRMCLGLLAQTDKWQAIDVALAGLRTALMEAGAPMTEANVAAAHIFEKRGQHYRAVTEYKVALSQDPENMGLQLALARAAELSGNMTTALDAYSAVLRKSPENAEARAALARIERDRKLLKAQGGHL